MKTQKVWFGVASVLVLGASVAAFGKFPGKLETMASGKASQSMTSEISMSDASMSMALTTCTPETCGSSVCDGNTCDSPACSGTSCKSVAGTQHEMSHGMAKMSDQGLMQPKMGGDSMMEPKM